jgi:hypothetical protein
MLLYHSTNDTGKAGIEREGFAVATNRLEQGKAWFHPHKRELEAVARHGWWVIVDMLDDVANEYLYKYGSEGEDTSELDRRFPKYHIPFDVVNAYQPFRYEPFSAEEWKAAGVTR